MKTLFVVACVATCCMGNLPVPNNCHGQLLNIENPSFYLLKAYGNTASTDAEWCRDRA